MDETVERPPVAKPRKRASKLSKAEQELAEMKAYAKRIASSRADSLDFLVRAGIATKKGELTKPYRS